MNSDQAKDPLKGCVITFNDNDATLKLVHAILAHCSLFSLGKKIKITRHPTIRQAVVLDCAEELQAHIQSIVDAFIGEYVKWMEMQHAKFVMHYSLYPGIIATTSKPPCIVKPEYYRKIA